MLVFCKEGEVVSLAITIGFSSISFSIFTGWTFSTFFSSLNTSGLTFSSKTSSSFIGFAIGAATCLLTGSFIVFLTCSLGVPHFGQKLKSLL